jgi:hypothetical protein
MSNRQLATDLKVAPETINRHLARIARQLMLMHCLLMKDVKPPSEVVIDGFETFEHSQYYPIHHHLAVEKDTDFVIYFTDSELRRKGRMTALQRKRRAELEAKNGRPDKDSISKDVKELLDVTLRGQSEAIVYSDGHKSYLKPIRETDCKILHRITLGKEHRNRDNELWEVNLTDLQIRHCSANHKRETIAWSKRRQCSSERMVIFTFWKNYMRGRRVKDPKCPTPAMARGMLDRKLEVEDVFRERIFFDHVELPARLQMYYWKTVSTRALDRERKHELRYAV